jgi:hypothetical protein
VNQSSSESTLAQRTALVFDLYAASVTLVPARKAVANSLRSRYVWKMSKPRRAWWRDLRPDEMAEHLLATPTITDKAWAEGEPRLPGENREAFIRRVLLGETAP